MSDQTEATWRRWRLMRDPEVFHREATSFDWRALLDIVEEAQAREEALRLIAEQVDVAMDGAAIYGVKAVLAPPYWRQWVEAHKALREFLNPALAASEPPGTAEGEEGT